MVMNNIPERSCVSRGGGGQYFMNQKQHILKKVYHKVTSCLFDYSKYESICHLRYCTKYGTKLWLKILILVV